MYINNISYPTTNSMTMFNKIKTFLFQYVYIDKSYIDSLINIISKELQLHNVQFDDKNFQFVGEANIPNTFAYFYYTNMTKVFSEFFDENLNIKKELIKYIKQNEISFYNVCEIITLKPNTVIIKLA